ncbi:UNVERIFIED_CONTAM: hypothetical protein FKN15_061759 [Acipenser sinensis]
MGFGQIANAMASVPTFYVQYEEFVPAPPPPMPPLPPKSSLCLKKMEFSSEEESETEDNEEKERNMDMTLQTGLPAGM